MQEDRMSLPIEQREVILGVDTHLDVHVAVVIDEVGRIVATNSFPTTASGYEQLMKWAGSFGRLSRAGVEGTGTYGAGLARHMQERGVQVLEINRPDRSRRRLRGKSDPTDAENAARVVLAGDANAIPKTQSGVVEAMRAVTMARRSAVKAKTQAINQLRALLVTAPAAIRATLWKVKPEQCVARCAQLHSFGDTPMLKALTKTLREPPRDFRRLHFLRGWSHEHIEEVFPGGAGTGGADGLRPPSRVSVAVGGDQVDRREDRLHRRSASWLGAPGGT
jgi:hypothetical protein